MTGYQGAAGTLLLVLQQFETTSPFAAGEDHCISLDPDRLPPTRSYILGVLLDRAFPGKGAPERYADPECYEDLLAALQVLAEHRRVRAARAALRTHRVQSAGSWFDERGEDYFAGRLGGRFDRRAGEDSRAEPRFGARLARRERLLDYFVELYHRMQAVSPAEPYEILDREGILRVLVTEVLKRPDEAVSTIIDGDYMEEFCDGDGQYSVDLTEDLLREMVEELYEDLHPWEMLERILAWNLVEVCLAKGLIRPRAPKLPLRIGPSIHDAETAQ